MINSSPPSLPSAEPENERLEAIVRTGPGGALVLAGVAAAIVLALWFAFYLLVFLPRGGAR
jgi:hypothetical protein